MKVVIESSFPVRGSTISRYASYPVFSKSIEETLVRELEFLKNYSGASLTMKVLI